VSGVGGSGRDGLRIRGERMDERDTGGTVVEEAAAGKRPGAAAEDRIASALRYLSERLFDPALAPSAVARHVGLDPWQFCRRFRTATGMTCNEFIARRRMHEARKLLARGDLLVKEVAYLVGFEDANYFSRRFKSVVGTTPTSYRKGNHAGAGRPGERPD